jgi:hypothetical protein
VNTDREVKALRSVKDPVARWRAVGDLQEQIALIVREIAGVRKEIILQMQSDGLSLQQVADQLGVSKTRIADIKAQPSASVSSRRDLGE